MVELSQLARAVLRRKLRRAGTDRQQLLLRYCNITLAKLSGWLRWLAAVVCDCDCFHELSCAEPEPIGNSRFSGGLRRAALAWGFPLGDQGHRSLTNLPVRAFLKPKAAGCWLESCLMHDWRDQLRGSFCALGPLSFFFSTRFRPPQACQRRKTTK